METELLSVSSELSLLESTRTKGSYGVCKWPLNVCVNVEGLCPRYAVGCWWMPADRLLVGLSLKHDTQLKMWSVAFNHGSP